MNFTKILKLNAHKKFFDYKFLIFIKIQKKALYQIFKHFTQANKYFYKKNICI